jgi:hypothetical protein
MNIPKEILELIHQCSSGQDGFTKASARKQLMEIREYIDRFLKGKEKGED